MPIINKIRNFYFYIHLFSKEYTNNNFTTFNDKYTHKLHSKNNIILFNYSISK